MNLCDKKGGGKNSFLHNQSSLILSTDPICKFYEFGKTTFTSSQENPKKLFIIYQFFSFSLKKLHQVYCAWLIKWMIKGEIIQVCLKKWWIISGTSRYWVSIRRYCLVLGGTGSVKTGTAWYYMVQGQHRACMPVYIGKSGDLVGWHRCLTHWLTHRQQNIVLLSFSPV